VKDYLKSALEQKQAQRAFDERQSERTEKQAKRDFEEKKEQLALDEMQAQRDFELKMLKGTVLTAVFFVFSFFVVFTHLMMCIYLGFYSLSLELMATVSSNSK